MHDGTLKRGALRPGVQVTIDHLESRIHGRTFNTYGGPVADKFAGGCNFVYFLHVEHQVGFSAVKTVRAKQNSECLCVEHGNVVHNYLTDNGVFKAKAFINI